MATPSSSSSRSTWAPAVAAFLVVGIAAGLRLFHLGSQGLFLDEAWSWATTLLPISGILDQMQVDFHPPVYFSLLKAWLAFFPATPAGLRGLSVLLSLASVLVLVVITRRLYGDAAAWLAGWWLAFSSFDIYYAQETRMYALLSLLFLLAYVTLFEALQGKPVHWAAWAVALLLMSWTHLYGLLFAGVHLAFLTCLWLFSRFTRGLPALPKFSLFAALSAGIGMLPIASKLFSVKDSGAGGSWMPSAADLLGLYTLTGSGVASARVPFLDGSHLVMPAFAGLPQWVWVLLSILTWGLFVFLGLRRAWQAGGLERLQALLALVFLVLPVCVAAYAALTARPQWAFKPFLGMACLSYLWAGVGLSTTKPLVRGAVASGVLLISLVTLFPYYSAWQKTDADLAFSSLPGVKQTGAILLEHTYDAPLAFYYRPAETEVWGLERSPDGSLALLRVQPPGVQPGGTRSVTCADARLGEISRLWVYGDIRFIKGQELPVCLQGLQFFRFKYPNWVSFSP